MTRIDYRLSGEGDWIAEIEALIDRAAARSVAELGGGAKPSLPPELIERWGLDYTVYDISEAELEKAGAAYKRRVADVTAPGFAGDARYDLVLSRWLLEHVGDPGALHRNVRDALVPGGRAMHFFPTLWSLPFVINRVLPERVSGRVLRGADEFHAGGERGKFPALYRWCRGPTRRQIERLEGTGLEVERYTGYFGHPYYRRLRPLERLHERRARARLAHPRPSLTSFASVVLVKPEAGDR